MKLAALILATFAFPAFAQYDASSLQSELQRDKVPMVQRLSQPSLLTNSEARVLRVYLLKTLVCQIQSSAAHDFCSDLSRSDELAGQTMTDLNGFAFQPANFAVVTQGLIGLLEGAETDLSSQGQQRDAQLLATIGSALSGHSITDAAQIISREVDAQVDLVGEFAQSPELEAFLPVLRNMVDWLKARPSTQALHSQSVVSVKSQSTKCQLSASGQVNCFQSIPPFSNLPSPLDSSFTVRKLLKGPAGIFCALSDASLACWNTSTNPSPTGLTATACIVARSKSKTLTFECDSRVLQATISADETSVALQRIHRPGFVPKHIVDNDSWNHKQSFEIELDASDLTFRGDELCYVDFNHELACTYDMKTDFSGFPLKNIEHLVAFEHPDTVCVLVLSAGWTCRQFFGHWDDKAKKYQSTGTRDWNFPRGELNVNRTINVVTNDTIYYVQNGGIHSFPRPPGSSSFIFLETDRPDSDFPAFHQNYCDVEAGHVVCREIDSQSKIEHPLLNLTQISGLILVQDDPSELDVNHLPGGKDGRWEATLCARAGNRQRCTEEVRIGDPYDPAAETQNSDMRFSSVAWEPGNDPDLVANGIQFGMWLCNKQSPYCDPLPLLSYNLIKKPTQYQAPIDHGDHFVTWLQGRHERCSETWNEIYCQSPPYYEAKWSLTRK